MIARRREEAAPGNGDEAVPAMLASLQRPRPDSASKQKGRTRRPSGISPLQ